MLLCSSSGDFEGRGWRTKPGGVRQVLVDLAGDVALEAADDLAFGSAFCCSAFDVVAGGLMVAHPDDRDDVERAVRRSVAAAAETVTTGGSAAACRLGSDPAEFGKRGFVAYPLRVVADGDEELASNLDANPGQLEQVRRCRAHEGLDLLVEGLDLFVQ